MAPTYFRREPGIATPAAIAAPHFRSTLLQKFVKRSSVARLSGRRYSRRVTTSPIALAKSNLRKAALERRDALPPAERTAAAEALAGRAFPDTIAPGTIISGYMPMKSELDPNNEVIVLLGDKAHVDKAFADAGIKDVKIVEPEYK